MIVITGASDGLGKELAKLYKNAGKTVVNISRNECEYADYNVITDLLDDSAVADAVTAIKEIREPIEAFVNCAGVLSIQALGHITTSEIRRVMTTNVESAMLLVSLLANRIKNDGADIVNVASTVGLKGYVDQAVYGASKWAMRGFSNNLQVELKDTACRVISFCPGGFKTKLFEKATGDDNTTNVGEWMKPEDLAKFMKQILDLPKNMEVSEVIINRKQTK
ncbi:MAG TPA: SDR family oxidoreductase [Candidatus Saccharibacteria bacterium]|jgi:NADP-dependent 3-hydroxy acid dehydrogenase YdfG|nr:SDR family oxidoreductase [Candidatus Saccharibacteria bacterium]HMT55926.1 SDR family oxidoreductase [Candidatus Saccharibacteria bacterium]